MGGQSSSLMINQTHAGGISSVSGLRLEGCVDTSLSRAADLAQKFESQPFCDLNEALSAVKPHLVTIAASTNSHGLILRTLLESSNAPSVALVEKPIARNIVEYKAIRELLLCSKTTVLVNMTRRYTQSSHRLKDLLSGGSLGKPQRVFCFYYGGLWNNGIHMVDYLDFLFGLPLYVTRIQGAVKSRFEEDSSIEFDATMQPGDIEVTVRAADESAFQLFELDIWLSGGRVKISDFGEDVRVYASNQNASFERVLIEADEPLDFSDFGETIELYRSIERFLRSRSEGDFQALSALDIKYHDGILGVLEQVIAKSAGR